MFYSTISNSKNTKKIKSNRRQNKAKRLAIIDLGTNSVRFDVYRLSTSKIEQIFRGKSMIRLGDGVFSTGKLSQEGMNRGLQAFIRFRQIMQEMKVDRVVVFGTSALRTASNAQTFVKAVKERTGISIRIISGSEEGRLIATGILSNITPPHGHFLLVDIGGGSTEVSVCYGKRILACRSLNLGASRLQQQYLKSSPPKIVKGKMDPVLKLRSDIKNELKVLSALVKKYPVRTVVGSSGTIRNISRILKKLGRSRKPMYRMDIAAMNSEIQGMTRDQLRRLPGLESKRIDIILAGSILLEEILHSANARQIYYTSFALRDGILYESV